MYFRPTRILLKKGSILYCKARATSSRDPPRLEYIDVIGFHSP
jgi:hypothetical protein